VVVDEFLRHRDTGAAGLTPEKLLADHAKLLPELAEELRKVELIEQARLQSSDSAALAAGAELSGPPPDSFPGYEIVRRIHRGGQGVVYEAVQKSAKRKVAIKVLRAGPFPGDEERIRFEREVQILASFKHPNIVAVHDSGMAAGHFYFVMDYIAGQPLDVYAASEARPIRDTLNLFEKIARAVHAAHVRGVMHRDLKPGNIRIDADGEPYILDFGLAKIADRAAPAGELPAVTMTGQFVGSLPWAAPEQVDGKPDRVDVRTDVYSLGVVLFQVLTGRFPYPVVGSMRAVMENILQVPSHRPSSIRGDLDDELDTIVLKCLSKEPERRYQSAGELARDIRHYLTGEPIEAKRDSTWYYLKKTVHRYKVRVAALLLFAVLTSAFLVTTLSMYRSAAHKAEENLRLTRSLLDLFHFAARAADEGEYVKAEQLFENALDLLRSTGYTAQPEAIAVLNSIGSYLVYMRGQAERGMPFVEEAFKAALALYPEDHEATARAYFTMAQHLHDMGRFQEAKDHYVPAIAIYDRLGLTARYWNAQYWLGLLHKDMQDYTAAEPLVQASLDAYRKLHGEQSKETSEMYLGLAKLRTDAGRFAEADRVCRLALRRFTLHFGEDHVRTSEVTTQLGQILVAQGRFAEAEPVLRQSLDVRRRELPPTMWELPKTATLLGAALAGLCRLEEAELLLLGNVDLVGRKKGSAHRRTAEALERIVFLYERWGRPDQAEPWRRQLHDHPFPTRVLLSGDVSPCGFPHGDERD
jgi:serine/threonine protein kinase/Flp pilus assembly protein TadD